jgi:hypothetical protein
MNPGERAIGPRDEHYSLISVLYHALQGTENCNTYALDAKAAGDQRLATFFREAGSTQEQLAEQTKAMLGIDVAPIASPQELDPPDTPSPSAGRGAAVEERRRSTEPERTPAADLAWGPSETSVLALCLAERADTLDDEGRVCDLVGGILLNACHEVPTFHVEYLSNLAALRAPDIVMGFCLKIVADRRLRPVLGFDQADLLQYRERLVNRAERHLGIPLLDEEVDFLGRWVPIVVLERLEYGTPLGGQGIP